VENAIKHGLEPKMDGGEIRITARADGAVIVIAVADTGLGSSNASGHGIGLDNVRERAAAVNGSLDYARNDSGGVTVTVRIPK
jgi:sensor histidine kinase YesM